MIHESIKKLLGDDLAKQVEEALKGKGKDGKDMDIVIGNDGSYVPADKHDPLKASLDASQQLVKDIAETVKNYGGSGDPASVKTDIQNAIKKLQDDADNKVAGIKFDAALERAIGGLEGVRSAKAVRALIDGQKDKLKLDGDGNLVGFKEIAEQLRKDEPGLFVDPEETKTTETTTTLTGAKPAQKTQTPEQADTLLAQVKGFMGLEG